MLRAVPELPYLPSILKWEISLALLVLVWSLISLGLGRSRRRGPVVGRWASPTTVVRRAERPRARPSLARRRRGRAWIAALGFAVAAASFAYAMPNIIDLAPGGVRDRAASARGRDAARPGRDAPQLHDGAPSAIGAPNDGRASVEHGGPSDDAPAQGEESGVIGELEVDGSDADGSADAPAPSLGGGSPAFSPEPNPSPTPTPTPEPTPEPSPTPEPTSPTPVPTSSRRSPSG